MTYAVAREGFYDKGRSYAVDMRIIKGDPDQLMKEQEAALRAATIPYLPEGTGYEQALWRIYPTPKPTAGPRVDEDEETSLFSLAGHAVAP